jgi:hypothetical protein
MKKILMIISFAALALVVAAPVLFYTETVSLEINKILLNTATAVWFASALGWMGREKKENA